MKELDIRPPLLDRLARQLSGGNQQKLVLAKWLMTQARVLILDEPTRGVDVATKVEIYQLISDLAADGIGILLDLVRAAGDPRIERSGPGDARGPRGGRVHTGRGQ